MQKNHIAELMTRSSSLTKSQALEAIDAFTDAVKHALGDGFNIYIRGFGTFKLVVRKPKIGRNIKKGTEVQIPAHTTVKFLPGNQMKSRLKNIPW